MLLLAELRDAWNAEPREHRVAVGVIVGVGVLLRLLYIGQPMRYDEAVTWTEFARYPVADVVSRYHYPNNHILHSLLVKASAAVLGNAPWVLRLPALIAGIVALPATYAVARTLYGSRAALFASALVSASGVLTFYSTNARGYSMVTLAFLLLVLVAVRLQRNQTLGMWAAYAAIAALGVWTIPVMLFPLGVVSLWLLLSLLLEGRRLDIARLAVTLVVGAALTFALYAPVLARGGLVSVAGNRFVRSSAWPQFLAELVTTSWQALVSWGLGLPPLVTGVVVALAAAALTRHASVSQMRVGVPVAAYAWCAWLLVVTHRAPFARVWLWAVPLGAALAGAGAVLVFGRWTATRDFVGRRAPLAAAVTCIAAALSVALSNAVRTTTDTGRYADAPAAAVALEQMLRPGDRIVAPIPVNGPLNYYLQRLGVDSTHLVINESQAERLLVVVDESAGSTVEAIMQTSFARDTARYGASVVARFPNSAILRFTRKHGTTRPSR